MLALFSEVSFVFIEWPVINVRISLVSGFGLQQLIPLFFYRLFQLN
jgi:hypothetical protein